MRKYFILFLFVTFIILHGVSNTYAAGTKYVNIGDNPTINWSVSTGGCDASVSPNTTFSFSGSKSSSGNAPVGVATSGGTWTFSCNAPGYGCSPASTCDSTTLIVCPSGQVVNSSLNGCVASSTTPTAALTISPTSANEDSTISYSLSSTSAGSCEVVYNPGNVTVLSKNANVTSWNTTSVPTAGTLTFTTQCWSGTNGTGNASTVDTDTLTISVVNGQCGTSNGQSVSSQPTSNLCTTGTTNWTDTAANDGTYNWSCAGSTSGTNASCSATLTVPYSCTGSDPANATMCSGDASGLSANTTKSVVTSCTATKCEFECNAGYVQSGSSCALCSAGYYCPGPGDGTSHICPANSYCPAGSSGPTACPTNYTSPQGSSASNQCIPPAGDACGTASDGTPLSSQPSSDPARCASGVYSDALDSGGYFRWSCGSVSCKVAQLCGSTQYWDGSSCASCGATGCGGCTASVLSPYNGCACNNGGTVPTCTTTSNDCNQQSVSWGSGCSGTINAAFNGNSNSVTNSASSYTGSATFSCSNGSFTYQNGTCSVVASPGCATTHYNCNDGATGTNTSYSGGYWTWGCPQGATANYYNCSEQDPTYPRCSTSHYTCTVGTSGSNNFSGNTYSWTCASGGNTVNCSEYAGPSGSLWGNDCEITTENGTSCSSTLHITTSSYNTTYDLTRDGTTITSYPANRNTSLSVTVSLPSTTFRLTDEASGSRLATKIMNASCGNGLVSDGTKCVHASINAGSCIIPIGQNSCNVSGSYYAGAVNTSGYNYGYNHNNDQSTPWNYTTMSSPSGTYSFSYLASGLQSLTPATINLYQANQNSSNPQFGTFLATNSITATCESGSVWSGYYITGYEWWSGDPIYSSGNDKCNTILSTPDLIVDSISGPEGYAGKGAVASFSVTARNVGISMSNNIPNNVPVLVQIAYGPNGDTTSGMREQSGSITTGGSWFSGGSLSSGSVPINFPNLPLGTVASYRACVDKSSASDTAGVVDEGLDGGEDNNCSSPWVNVTLVTPGKNLTAGNVTAPSVTVGNPATFSVVISNIGSQNITENNFRTKYQFAASAGGVGTKTNIDATSFDSSLVNHPNSTTSASVSKVYTLPGTYSVRACADQSVTGSLDDLVTETDESDNCSPTWTNFTVTGAALLPDITSSVTTVSTWVNGTYQATVRETNSGTDATGAFYAGAVLYDENDYTNPSVTHSTNQIASLDSSSNATTFFSGGPVAPALYDLRTCGDNPPAGAWYAAHFIGMSGFYAVDESNENNNCAISDTFVNTRSGTRLDLVAGKIRPTSANNISYTGTMDINAGDTNTYYVPIGNLGTVATPSDFYTLFQIEPVTGAWSDIVPATLVSGGIGGGAVKIVSTSYRFSTAGSYYMRACADKSSAGDTGLIAEDPGYEDNNCGPTTLITVTGTASCSPGEYDNNGTCTICPIGHYCDGIDPPTLCLANTYCDGGNTPPGGTSKPPVACPNGTTAPAGSGSAASCVCPSGYTYDTTNSVCVNPQVVSAVVSGAYYYTSPEAITLTCTNTCTNTCANSLKYSVYKDGTAYVATSTYSGVTSIPVAVTGNYKLYCAYGSVSDSVTKSYHSPPPDGATVSVEAYPKTITSGGKSIISWSIANPTITGAGCSISAAAVCTNGICTTPTSAGANGGRDTQHEAKEDQTTAINRIKTILATGYTDDGRRIVDAVKYIATGQTGSGAKAIGKKTLQISYTTDFTVDCGNGKRATARVRIANSNEQ